MRYTVDKNINKVYNGSMNYTESLKNLGLKKQEAEIYLACLRLGMSKVSELAEEVDVPRTSIYVYAKDLTERGYLKKTKKGGTEYFSAISPSLIQKEWQEKVDSFAGVVPNLEKLLDFPGKKSSVEYFDTRKGIMKLYETMLDMDYNHVPYLIEGGEAVEGVLEKLGEDFQYRWQKRMLGKGVVTQGIITKSVLKVVEKLSDKTREIAMQRPATIRVIDDKTFPFSVNLYLLYPESIFVLVPQENFVITIKNKNIYKSLVTLYHLLYAQGEQISLKKTFELK